MADWSTRRITRLAQMNNTRNYLEIGVCKGDTFKSLDLRHKTGVDPEFQFDALSISSENVHLWEITSDEFFSSHYEIPAFDLVFLDGMHTYEQTYRDFINAISRSHSNTLFIIDDTLPSDRFSSIRDEGVANTRRRQESLIVSSAWHGDVYKCLILISLFHTNINYATITDQGNPQTVLWRRSLEDKTNNKPFIEFQDKRYLLKVFEDLDSADFHWLTVECPDILQPCKEDDILSFLSLTMNK